MKTKMHEPNPRRRASLRGLLEDVRGATTVEYVIVLVLIGASAIGAWRTFGKTVRDKLGDADKEFGTIVNVDQSDEGAGEGSGSRDPQ